MYIREQQSISLLLSGLNLGGFLRPGTLRKTKNCMTLLYHRIEINKRCSLVSISQSFQNVDMQQFTE